MPTPFDGLLPINAKYISLVETEHAYNSHWDITWSFTYALTGIEHGICTFLVGEPTNLKVFPGNYLGYGGPLSSNGVLGIAFDSTGLFALSTAYSTGVNRSAIIPNSLIVRNFSGGVIYNNSLSSIDPNFTISTVDKTFKTIRIRYSNLGSKISIDYRYNDEAKYTLLLNLSNIPVNVDRYPLLYPGVSFSSPISSSSITPSKIWIKNIHTQGNINEPTFETLEFTPLTSILPTTYTTVSGISAKA
jgi:hypothetical protein